MSKHTNYLNASFMKNQILIHFVIAAVLLLSSPILIHAENFPPSESEYNVKKHGAKADGKTMDTPAIQKAIDECNRNGGGTVYFPSGIYLSGSIHLKNNITLYLENGATILASPNDDDFDPYEKLDFKNDSDKETSYFHFSLIWGEDVENIAILGNGTIDCNRKDREGPKTIGLKRCKYVTIKDITIRNSGNYAISMLGTDFVNIDGISIFASYADGIDPDCCHNVRIANSYIESWDDAICPKTSYSLGYKRSTEYITVTNCIIATTCQAFKLGTESGGDFKHITVSNCVMTTYKSKVNHRAPSRTRRPISGITLISADGANIENVNINNIVMDKVRYPFFIRLANRGRDQQTPVPGTIKDVTITNITISDAYIGGMIIGLPDHPIENIYFDNINLSLESGDDEEGKYQVFSSSEQLEKDIEKAMKKYPEATKFNNVPVYGLYMRHIKTLNLKNLRLSTTESDKRHALDLYDVKNVTIDDFYAPTAQNAASQLFFYNVTDSRIRNCSPETGKETFLEVSGEKSNNILMINNDFRNTDKISVLDKGLKDNIVISEFNLYKNF